MDENELVKKINLLRSYNSAYSNYINPHPYLSDTFVILIISGIVFGIFTMIFPFSPNFLIYSGVFLIIWLIGYKLRFSSIHINTRYLEKIKANQVEIEELQEKLRKNL